MSEDINFEIGDVDEVGHWMMSAREDTLRRRRLLCPNFEFDQHEESRYGYRKSNSASPRSPPPDLSGDWGFDTPLRGSSIGKSVPARGTPGYRA